MCGCGRPFPVLVISAYGRIRRADEPDRRGGVGRSILPVEFRGNSSPLVPPPTPIRPSRKGLSGRSWPLPRETAERVILHCGRDRRARLTRLPRAASPHSGRQVETRVRSA